MFVFEYVLNMHAQRCKLSSAILSLGLQLYNCKLGNTYKLIKTFIYLLVLFQYMQLYTHIRIHTQCTLHTYMNVLRKKGAI